MDQCRHQFCMYIGLCNEGNVIQKLLFFFAKNTTCVSCSSLFIKVLSVTARSMSLSLESSNIVRHQALSRVVAFSSHGLDNIRYCALFDRAGSLFARFEVVWI
jgi:hypothetical protein